jgi:hypothetical protein
MKSSSRLDVSKSGYSEFSSYCQRIRDRSLPTCLLSTRTAYLKWRDYVSAKFSLDNKSAYGMV